MTLAEIIGQLRAAVTHARAGDFLSSWEDTIPVQQEAIRIFKKGLGTLFGINNPELAAEARAELVNLKEACSIDNAESLTSDKGDPELVKAFAESFIEKTMPAICPNFCPPDDRKVADETEATSPYPAKKGHGKKSGKK